MRLEGKTALITGAGSGMGRVAAVLFAREGANVIATDISQQGLDDTAMLVAEHTHGSILPLAGDVSDEDDVRSWIEAGVQRYGALNVLYNNAGIFPDADRSVLEMDEATYQRTLDVNLKGVMLCCKHGIPEIVRAGGGSVVNVASFVALVGCTVPLLAGLFPNEEEKMKRLSRIPLGRFGRPEDIVYAALYLASDESSWTTGTEFVVDGGITVNYF
jgi:NAD(P)-dependent dehydrogenase (short-subunit alcohol dehydrogenase family)